jgi:diaminopimelate epimerase
MQFYKYHALGNDYLIFNTRDCNDRPEPDQIRTICHRHFGIGSDGILWGPHPQTPGKQNPGLKIFNPDGSEAEKSGNGLRIFARFLWDQGLIKMPEFEIDTMGGMVTATILPHGNQVRVQMGQVSFDSRNIPVAGPPREVVDEPISIDGAHLRITAATIGNPHCVIVEDKVTPDLARELGPRLETHSFFPHRTNVQFVQVLDRTRLRIEIWERGAGYTLASGSSSSAAAAAAHRMGLCDSTVRVQMPGGTIEIEVSPDYQITMTGPVTRVCEGVLDPEIFTH